MKKTLVLGLALTLVALVLPRSAAAATPPELYKSKCATCHAENGSGDTTMGKNLKLRDLGSADVQKQSDDVLKKLITDGKGKMPAYKSKLSSDEIDALVKQIRTFKK